MKYLRTKCSQCGEKRKCHKVQDIYVCKYCMRINENKVKFDSKEIQDICFCLNPDGDVNCNNCGSPIIRGIHNN